MNFPHNPQFNSKKKIKLKKFFQSLAGQFTGVFQKNFPRVNRQITTTVRYLIQPPNVPYFKL